MAKASIGHADVKPLEIARVEIEFPPRPAIEIVGSRQRVDFHSRLPALRGITVLLAEAAPNLKCLPSLSLLHEKRSELELGFLGGISGLRQSTQNRDGLAGATHPTQDARFFPQQIGRRLVFPLQGLDRDQSFCILSAGEEIINSLPAVHPGFSDEIVALGLQLRGARWFRLGRALHLFGPIQCRQARCGHRCHFRIPGFRETIQKDPRLGVAATENQGTRQSK